MADESLVLFNNKSLRLCCIDSSMVWFTSLQTQTQDTLYVVKFLTSLPVFVTECDVIVVDGDIPDVCEQSTVLDSRILLANLHALHPGTSIYLSHLLRKQPVLLIEYPLQSESLSHSVLQTLLLAVKLLYGDTAFLLSPCKV